MPRTNRQAAAAGSVRVPRVEFDAVWREALRRDRTATVEHRPDWYLSAVVSTCRWLSGTPMRTALCGGMARAPMSQRACPVREASVELEWQLAQEDRALDPDLAGRPGWREGVLATLRWAWRADGAPPVEVLEESTSPPPHGTR